MFHGPLSLSQLNTAIEFLNTAICAAEVNVGSARSGFSSDELIPITSVELNLKQTCKDLCKGVALNYDRVATLKNSSERSPRSICFS